MKKALQLTLLAFGLWLLASVPARAQFYGVNLLEFCWTTGGGQDSTIYGAILSAAATTKPTKIHFFDLDNSGNPFAVNVTGGNLRNGPCSNPGNDSIIVNIQNIISHNDTIIVRLDAILDSLSNIITNTQEPQSCDCIYELDQQNFVWSNINNSRLVNYGYDRVVTRNCGAGVEEIFRNPESVTKDQSAHIRYKNSDASGSAPLQNGLGFIDQVTVFLKNPYDTLIIDLNPSTVKASYPTLGAGFDSTTLIFNSAAPATMKGAIDAVINAALNSHAAANLLPSPTRALRNTVSAAGVVEIGFYIYHQPAGHYANIDNGSGAVNMTYFPDGVTTNSVYNLGEVFSGVVETAYYNTPCGSINTTYSAFMTDNTALKWDSIGLITPVASLVASKGTATCTMACPETPDCVQICNTTENPVPVQIVEDCLTEGVTEWVEPSGNLYSIPANTVSSITVGVITGPVTLSMNNAGSPVSRTLPTGATWTATAGECKLLQTGYSIDATGGDVLISIFK